MNKFYTKLSLASIAMLTIASGATATPPSPKTSDYIAAGSEIALGRITISGKMKEKGLVYSDVNPEPTIEDGKSDMEYENNGTIYCCSNLKPSTFYWVRAYAINTSGEAGYGEVRKIVTLPKGTIEYSYNTAGDATEEIDTRIKEAADHACKMWNMTTGIKGFHPTINYSSGTPTADCSYGGWIRMGANPSYQRAGTLLHEMNHGVGVGQHVIWYGPNSAFRSSGNTGDWLGRRATALVRFLDNSKTSVMKGDGTHMWPYGINGAHEDNGTDILYICNGMITWALGEDALPHVANKFHTGCWNIKAEKGEKYYIKNENSSNHNDTRFLYEDADNTLTWGELSVAEAAAFDNAAWYLEYDPVNCAYIITNAGTGNRLTLNKTKYQTVSSEEKITDYDRMVLTEWIRSPKLYDTNMPTYWITSMGNKSHNPGTMTLVKDAVKTVAWTTDDAKGQQRWHIFNEASLQNMLAGVQDVTVDKGNVETFPGDVYDISGRLVKKNAENLDELAPGIYIVNGKKFIK